MKIQLLEIAQIELDEAVEYYNSESHGLGDEFLLDLLKAIERVSLFPKAWHPFSNSTRRCRLRRFPYGIIYQIQSEEIIANLHRKPDYWKERIIRPLR